MPDSFFDKFAAAWNSHDGQQVRCLMAEGGTYEDVALGRVVDPTEVVDFVTETDSMSSDYTIEWVSTQRDGNRYAGEWLMKGTNDGPIAPLNVPATGKQWEIRGVSVGEFDDDERIKVNRDYWNVLAWLTQLGVMPSPAATQ